MNDVITKVENTLNDYPIQGFKFAVQDIEVTHDLIVNDRVRLNIRGNQSGDGTHIVDIVAWFYLALDDYAKKINANRLEFTIHQDKYVNLLAEIETMDTSCIFT